MTKTIFQNWKVIAGLSIAVVLLGSALTVGTFMPKAEAGHTATSVASKVCGVVPGTVIETVVHHWDKIIFQIVRDPSGTVNQDYLKTPLDIKVEDDPDRAANIVMKVRQFMGDHGIAGLGPATDPNDPTDPTVIKINAVKLDIIDVDYAIVCSTGMIFVEP